MFPLTLKGRVSTPKILMNSKFLLTPKKIREAREKQGLTRADIAKELGFTPGNTTSIWMWEKGEREVPPKHHQKLLNILGLENEVPEAKRFLDIQSSEFKRDDDFSKNENISDRYETIGSGDNSVYLYYYPNYKENAKLKGEENWKCKIGRTEDTDPNIRINQQITGMPEQVIIGLVILTNEPVKLEGAIHRLLKHFDRHISDAPGAEWFLTSPDEIRELYNLLIEE